MSFKKTNDELKIGEYYSAGANKLYQIKDIENDVIFLYRWDGYECRWVPRMFNKEEDVVKDFRLISYPFVSQIIESTKETKEKEEQQRWKSNY